MLSSNRLLLAAFVSAVAIAAAQSAPPAAAVTVTRAVYRAAPQGNRLQITADLELRQSVAESQTLPLNLGAMMSLEAATLDGLPAPLMRDSDGRTLLFVNKRGTAKLQLQLSAALHRIGSDRTAVVMPVANAPASLTVEVPANRSLRIDGSLVTRAKPLREKSQHTLAVGNRKRVELRFTSNAAANGLDSVVLAESRSTLALSAGLADWNCETQFLVTGTPRKTFESSVAGRMQITGVSGHGIADWSVSPAKDDPSRNAVRITFRKPFTGTRTVRLTGRTALPTEPFWQVPNFVINGVDSHAGHVAVSFPRNDGIRVDEFAGLRQSAGLPGGTQPKILPAVATNATSAPRRVLAFDFWKQDFELNLVLPKRRSAGAADVVTVFDVHRGNVQLEFTAGWEPHATQRGASLSLPAEWSIRTVTINGSAADWKTLPVEADVQHLRIALPSADAEQSPSRRVRLAVTAVRDLEYPEKRNAAAVWKLPVVRLPDARLLRGRIFLRHSGSVAVGIADSDRLQAIAGRDGRDAFAYRYTLRHEAGSGFGATVAVRRQPAAFCIEALTIARLDRTALRTKHRIHVTPEASGFRTLELLLPRNARLQSAIRWNAAFGRLLHSEQVATEAGRQRWKLRFDRTVKQPGFLVFELAVKRPKSLQEPVKLEAVEFPDAERTTGFLMMAANARQRLDVAANYRVARADQRNHVRPLPLAEMHADEILRRFRQEDLLPPRPSLRVAAAYRYVLPDIDVSLTESRLPGGSSAMTCNRQRLQTTLSRSGALRHSVEYELSGVDGEEVRVQLPEGAELWAATCDGKSVVVRRDGDSLLLRISPGRVDPARTRLQLVYLQKQEISGGGGRLQMHPPTIAFAAGTQQPLTIVSSTWALHHPRDVNVIAAAGELRPVQPLDEPGWLKRLGGWIAARNFTLLVLLLSVPFAWITIRFLQFAAERRHVRLSKSQMAGCLLAVVLLPAVILFGRRSEPEIRDQRSEVGILRIRPTPDLRPPSSDLRPLAVKRFEYVGATDEPVSLSVTYQTRGGGSVLRLCVLVGVLVCCWLLRHRSPRLLATLAVLGVMCPLVVTGWFPAAWQPFVDGVFFGTLTGAAAWGLATAFAAFRRRRRGDFGVHVGRTAARAVARLLPFAVLVIPAANLPADDAKPTSAKVFVTSANYAIAIRNSVAESPNAVTVTARYNIASRHTGRHSVTLPLGRVAITAATLDGKPAIVTWRRVANGGTPSRDSRPRVIGPPGSKILTLTFSLPLQSDADGMQFTLPLRPVASGRCVVELPSMQMQARFRGLIGTYRRTVLGKKHFVEFPADKSRDVTVRLKETTAPPDAATVLLHSTDSRAEIKDSGIFQRDELALRASNGALESWTGRLPGGYRVTGIAGPDVAGWELSATQSENRTVRVDFRKPIAGSTRIVFSLFRAERFTAEPSTIVLRQVGGSTPSRRTIAVSAGREFLIRHEKGESKRVSATIAGDARTWQLSGEKPSLSLQVSRRTPRTAVAAEHAVMLERGETRVTSRLTYDFLGSPRTKLTLLLPDGYTLHSLRGSHGAEWSHGSDESTVIVVYPKPQSETVRLVLDGTLRRKPSLSKLELMLPGPMAAHRLTVTAGFWHANELMAKLTAADGWQQLTHDEIPAAIQARHPQPPAIVLRTSSPEPNPLVWQLTHPATRIEADTLTLVRVTDTAAEYTLLLKWSGGLRGRPVAISAPQWLGRKLRFKPNRHVRIEPDLATHDGHERMRWLITGFAPSSQTPAWEREIAVIATATLPPPLAGGNRVAAPKLEIQEPAGNGQTAGSSSTQYAAVKRSRHFAVLLNESRDRLERATLPKFREFALSDLPRRLKLSPRLQRRITRATERLRLDGVPAEPFWNWKPVLAESRGTAVINRAELTTLLERDGSWRLRAVYQMRNGSRPYLALKLPADSRLLAAHVAGRTAQVAVDQKRDDRLHLVPLPRRADGRRSFAVRLLIVGRLPAESFRGGFRSLLDGSQSVSLPAPRVVPRTEDPELGIPVQETVWTVSLADGLTAAAVGDSTSTNMARGRVLRSGSPPASTPDISDRQSPAALVRGAFEAARDLYDWNCKGSKSTGEEAPRCKRDFEFPLDDNADRSAAVNPQGRSRSVPRGAQPWAGSIESETAEPLGTQSRPQKSAALTPEFEFLVPVGGQTLTFRKAGGDPQIMLRIRSREATQTRRRILWSLVWATIGGVALVLVHRRRRPSNVERVPLSAL